MDPKRNDKTSEEVIIQLVGDLIGELGKVAVTAFKDFVVEYLSQPLRVDKLQMMELESSEVEDEKPKD